MTVPHRAPREEWQTRIGLILAMAGNAIGLGNFLRFPVQCAQNGGGAFMIPYFIALVLLGIPLMWVEWGMGRFGGQFGHGTTPGMFHNLWKNPLAKYLGGIGIVIPLCLLLYYCYIESWTLGYAFFSLTGQYFGIESREGMAAFLGSYQGKSLGTTTPNLLTAYIFFAITMAVNFYIVSKGIVGGIEKFVKFAMPLLFVMGGVLLVRVFTLGAPNPEFPERSVERGLAFIWNPDYSRLTDTRVWLAAAGQIFFTLSLGFGAIQTYASYIRKKDDIILSGLTTTMTNEFAEVILGGSIAIPVAVAFFGVLETQAIARGGAFDLGFQAMPIIFQRMPLGEFFGFVWFGLLFFAGITSSIAMAQPAVAFLQEEFGIERERAVAWLGVLCFLFSQPVILFLDKGFLDEMDFWVGTFGLACFAMIEIILFVWVFGMDKAWAEMNRGRKIRLPRFFYWVIKFVTPTYLFLLLVVWFTQQGIGVFLMKDKPVENQPYLWMARLMMLGILAVVLILIRMAWQRKALEAKKPHRARTL